MYVFHMDAGLTMDEARRPWLAVGVVALMAQTPIRAIQSWSDRGLLPDVLPAEGRKLGKRFSLAAAVKVGAMHLAVSRVGMTPARAEYVGDVVMDRFLMYCSDRSYFHFSDDVLFVSFAYSKPQHEFHSRAALADPNNVTPLGNVTSLSFGMGAAMLQTDYLCARIMDYRAGLTEEFNQLALEGRLKPFPKELR